MTEVLEDIAMLRPGKNAQIAAKKISKKYHKARSRKRKLAGEVDPCGLESNNCHLHLPEEPTVMPDVKFQLEEFFCVTLWFPFLQI